MTTLPGIRRGARARNGSELGLDTPVRAAAGMELRSIDRSSPYYQWELEQLKITAEMENRFLASTSNKGKNNGNRIFRAQETQNPGASTTLNPSTHASLIKLYSSRRIIYNQ